MGRAAALQAERLQRHTSILTKFHDGQPGIQIERQASGPDLIEGCAPAMRMGLLDKSLDQFRPLADRPDRIAQGDPTASSLAEHQRT